MHPIDFYATPGPMTLLGGLDAAVDGMPTDPAGITGVVQGLLLHPFWAEAYAVDVPPDRTDDVQIRGAAAMVERILAVDPRPLIERRERTDRFFGNCRHFSVLTVALLRHAGVPSRARCGFASYFEPGRWVDHWVVEHWDGGRWVVLDAQIDPFQREATGLTADPADMPPGLFLAAGEAWLRCQAGLEDGDHFGILDQWGQWFIEGNIARDLASLNKVEMLPWDVWGSGWKPGEQPTAAQLELFDAVAELTVDPDRRLRELQTRYQSDDTLRMPGTVFNVLRNQVETV